MFEAQGGWMKVGITAGLVAASVVLAQGELSFLLCSDGE